MTQQHDILSIYSIVSARFFNHLVPVEICNTIFSYLVDTT